MGDGCRDHTGDQVGTRLTFEAFIGAVTSDGTTAASSAATWASSNSALQRPGRSRCSPPAADRGRSAATPLRGTWE